MRVQTPNTSTSEAVGDSQGLENTGKVGRKFTCASEILKYEVWRSVGLITLGFKSPYRRGGFASATDDVR